MNDKLEYAKKIVKDAGLNIKKLMEENVEIDTKSSANDFVTNVDKATERFLVERINKRFENQDFLTEEKTTNRVVSDDLWIIDPIDGTTNFIYQRMNFAISLAFYHQCKPVFGIVYDVIADKIFVGVTGQGATLNGKPLLTHDQNRKLKQSIIYGDLYSLSMFPEGVEALRKDIVSHRYLGAASLEICAVCENKAQAYISRNLKVWDVAAAVIVLNETKGTYFFGGYDNELYYNDLDGVFLSAQNNTILHELKQKIAPDLLNEINKKQ